VVIYCAGSGAASPAVADGEVSMTLSHAQNPVTVMIGGQTISNPILAALARLYQINITGAIGNHTGG